MKRNGFDYASLECSLEGQRRTGTNLDFPDPYLFQEVEKSGLALQERTII